MARLIDADALHRKVKMETNPYGKPTIDYDSGVKVLEWIEQAPTVDAVEVVHGRWEEMHYEGGILDGTNFDRCSVCGYERVFDDPALKTVFKYCPNCGATMDEKE